MSLHRHTTAARRRIGDITGSGPAAGTDPLNKVLCAHRCRLCQACGGDQRAIVARFERMLAGPRSKIALRACTELPPTHASTEDERMWR